MASSVLSEYLNKKVAVISTDGGLFIGLLEGYDHSTNIALRETIKRNLTSNRSSTDEHVGLYVIRGDCVSVIGEVDDDLDAHIDWNSVVGQPFNRFR